jgi:hypothetical protein
MTSESDVSAKPGTGDRVPLVFLRSKLVSGDVNEEYKPT